ncbi:hypothetical protein NEMIN01_0012 [Nematocida minor]|uniref:uncharacterized protein n=1 Tax=Nematocida minor TaxID=1912983 RepID=UPI0022201F87|nr:uncharacterized protein NEMIN01_0005 [Nematocida minor]XP_051331914.1 uncharacterized protein NEMIN01_0012 [Nematocida minor]KAI5188741.1 hypothetical protein NEMIN01_0005 [Nematocida minor]KAI5188748.1 hypothetical protein NEMIN01_0012 [Nematocida minor]
MEDYILSTLKAIKDRLENLQAQRRYIPNANKPMFPFVSAMDVLNKISNEEDYLHREASKLKEQLPLHGGSLGKDSHSLEVDTLFYSER